MRRSWLCWTALVIALPAGAELETIDYQAQVVVVPSDLSSTVSVGDPVSGRFRFETTTADTDPDPTVGFYPGAVHQITLGAWFGTSTQSFLRIYDDGSMPPFDGYQVGDFDTSDELPPLGGRSVESLFFALNGGTTLFATDAIPPGLPPFGNPVLFESEVVVSISPSGGGLDALIAQLTAVTLPEPAQGGVAVVAALAFLGVARRTRAESSPAF